MRTLFPLLFGLIGIAGGVGAGLALKPPHEETTQIHPCGDVTEGSKGMHSEASVKMESDMTKDMEQEYIKLNNQFVVPVVSSDKVSALVVMSLSIEIDIGQSEEIYKREPKLRDAFSQILFDHANIGGFEGEFTNANNMAVLRSALKDVAQSIVGAVVSGVLITDIARQDI